MSRKLLKHIPLIKRLYPSIAKKILNLIGINNINYKFFNVNFVFNINEPIDKEILLFNYYENKQINFLIKNLNKNNFDYFFDVGANSGLYSLIIAKMFKEVKVKSFEPIPLSINKIKINLSINKYIENVQLYEFGLSNKNSELLMKAYKKDDFVQTGGFGVAKKGEDLKNLHTEKANFKKTDDFINITNKFLIIKIDTEGHEHEVLEGMEKVIFNNKILFQIEIFDENFSKIDGVLKKHNFHIFNSIKSEHKTDYYYKNY